MCTFASLVGHTITGIKGAENGSDQITIETDKGTFSLYRSQECCEDVTVEDIAGEPWLLVGQKVLAAYKTTSDEPSRSDETTWSFYHIRTNLETVTLRWLGVSNGYYGTEVKTDYEPHGQGES